MFHQILFPIDFNDTSLSILPFVLNVAEKFHAKIHLLYVVENLNDSMGWATPYPSLSTFADGIEAAARKKMKALCDDHFDVLQHVARHVILGDPAEDVIRFAKENGMDLIIMATHGRKGLDRVIFGSVAENVARQSPIPVMLINPHRLDRASFDLAGEKP